MLRPIPLAVAQFATPALACDFNAKAPVDASGLSHDGWRIVHCDGTEAAGAFHHGARHGSWAIRYPDRRTDNGAFVDDLRDGRWSYHYPETRGFSAPAGGSTACGP